MFTKFVQAADEAEFDGTSIDNLQRVLGIKDAVAERIGQSVMMEKLQESMKEEGKDGESSSANPIENAKVMVDMVKEALESDEETRASFRKELADSFRSMGGLTIENLIDVLSAQKDPLSLELGVLLKKLIDPKFKSASRSKKPDPDDLLGI